MFNTPVLRPVKNILIEITETSPETITFEEKYVERETIDEYFLEAEFTGYIGLVEKYSLEAEFTNHVDLTIVESEPNIIVIKAVDERVEDFAFPFLPYDGSGGGTGIDLSNYYTKSEIDRFLSNIYTKSDIQVLLSLYYTKSEIDEKLGNLIVDCGTY
jgi:hypothetical protein